MDAQRQHIVITLATMVEGATITATVGTMRRISNPP
jgi:hypothetical protein